MQCQRLGIGPPYAHVVAGFAATGEIEVDLHAELVLGHGQLPEKAVASAFPGHGSMPQVIGGPKAAVFLFSCGHGAPICTVSVCPRLLISWAADNEVFSMLRTSAFL